MLNKFLQRVWSPSGATPASGPVAVLRGVLLTAVLPVLLCPLRVRWWFVLQFLYYHLISQLLWSSKSSTRVLLFSAMSDVIYEKMKLSLSTLSFYLFCATFGSEYAIIRSRVVCEQQLSITQGASTTPSSLGGARLHPLNFFRRYNLSITALCQSQYSQSQPGSPAPLSLLWEYKEMVNTGPEGRVSRDCGVGIIFCFPRLPYIESFSPSLMDHIHRFYISSLHFASTSEIDFMAFSLLLLFQWPF